METIRRDGSSLPTTPLPRTGLSGAATLPAEGIASDTDGVSRRSEAKRWIAGLHDELTSFVGRLDEGGTFAEDRWERPGGSAGVARVMSDGVTFETAGVNRSVASGALPELAARRLGGKSATADATHFFAADVRLALHPRSPRVPTVHLDVRYIELTDARGLVTDRWFAGGTDLTPYFPQGDDAVTFHRELRAMCDRHHANFYPAFKQRCDEYFVNGHRQNEARGIGGIYFDRLSGDDPSHRLSHDQVAAFVSDVARVLLTAYEPIVARRRHQPFTAAHRDFQLVRRGRHVEFNLLHDRGTIFDLPTPGRIESVLESLPPLAKWDHAPRYAADSFEAQLLRMLPPRDWAAGDSTV